MHLFILQLFNNTFIFTLFYLDIDLFFYTFYLFTHLFIYQIYNIYCKIVQPPNLKRQNEKKKII